MKPRTFGEELSINLTYGSPCRYKHRVIDNPDKNIRYKSGKCLACYCFLDNGPFKDPYTDIGVFHSKAMSTEDRRVKHIQQQMEWNKRNPEKFKQYQQAYQSTPEYKEKMRLRYESLTPEKKKEIYERNYASRKILLAKRRAEKESNDKS